MAGIKQKAVLRGRLFLWENDMDDIETKALLDDVSVVMRALVSKALVPVLSQCEALQREVDALKQRRLFEPTEIDQKIEAFNAGLKQEREAAKAEGKEKRKAALAELKAGILADCETIMAEKIAAIPAPKDIDLGEINANLEDLRKSVDAIPAPLPPPEFPDVAAMIANAIEAAKPEPVDVKGMIAEAIVATEFKADIETLRTMFAVTPDLIAELAALKDATASMGVMIAEHDQTIETAVTSDDIAAKIAEVIAALPPAENGKDADPELMASLVKETVEHAVAALPAAKEGAPGADGVTLEELLPVIDQTVAKAVSAIPVPKDGRNAVDLADMLVVEGGNVVATFTDGRTKVLGPFRGKDGEAGKDGKDVDFAEIERVIAEQVAKIQPPEIERDAYLAAFAPDDVASNVSLAVKMMAETPQTVPMHQRSEAPPINIHSNVSMPEIKFPENMVNVSMPEMTVAAPIVNVDPVTNNVMPDASKKRKEITTVTGWDKNGRITSFEKTEADK